MLQHQVIKAIKAMDSGEDEQEAISIAVSNIPSKNGKRLAKEFFARNLRKTRRESVELEEKAVSQAQQKLMGMALAYKRGEMDDASDEVKKVANSMSEKDLEDFAKTKHDNLPMKKEKYLAAAYNTIKSQKKY